MHRELRARLRSRRSPAESPACRKLAPLGLVDLGLGEGGLVLLKSRFDWKLPAATPLLTNAVFVVSGMLRPHVFWRPGP